MKKTTLYNVMRDASEVNVSGGRVGAPTIVGVSVSNIRTINIDKDLLL